MSLFNEHQQGYMNDLAKMDASLKCPCGWYTVVDCAGYCNIPEKQTPLIKLIKAAINNNLERAACIADDSVKNSWKLKPIPEYKEDNIARASVRLHSGLVAKNIRELKKK